MKSKSKIDINHVATLANLTLSQQEKAKFGKQLSQTLDYIQKLEEVDTKGTEPTSQVTGLENILRDDEAELSLTQEDVLKNTALKHDGFFKVKAILQEE